MATWDWERVGPTKIESGIGEVPVGKIRDPFLKMGRWGTEQADSSWAHSASMKEYVDASLTGKALGTGKGEVWETLEGEYVVGAW